MSPFWTVSANFGAVFRRAWPSLVYRKRNTVKRARCQPGVQACEENVLPPRPGGGGGIRGREPWSPGLSPGRPMEPGFAAIPETGQITPCEKPTVRKAHTDLAFALPSTRPRLYPQWKYWQDTPSFSSGNARRKSHRFSPESRKPGSNKTPTEKAGHGDRRG